MFSRLFLVVTAISCGLIKSSESKGHCRSKGIDPVPVNLKWFDSISNGDGWVFIEQGDIEPLAQLPTLPTDPSDLEDQRCWTVAIQTPIGPLQIPGNCKFKSNQIEKSWCSLDTGDNAELKKIFVFHPQANIIMTNNVNYVLSFTCVNGAYVWWALLTRKGVTLDADTLDAIEAKKKELGLEEGEGLNGFSITSMKTTGGCKRVYDKDSGSLLDIKLLVDLLDHYHEKHTE